MPGPRVHDDGLRAADTRVRAIPERLARWDVARLHGPGHIYIYIYIYIHTYIHTYIHILKGIPFPMKFTKTT